MEKVSINNHQFNGEIIVSENKTALLLHVANRQFVLWKNEYLRERTDLRNVSAFGGQATADRWQGKVENEQRKGEKRGDANAPCEWSTRSSDHTSTWSSRCPTYDAQCVKRNTNIDLWCHNGVCAVGLDKRTSMSILETWYCRYQVWEGTHIAVKKKTKPNAVAQDASVCFDQ